MKKIVVLHSGGLDSTIMFELAKKESDNVVGVYFDIGHEYAWKEKEALPKDVIVHDMQWFQAEGRGKEGNGMNNIFIPGRNMMFATLAACKYVPDEIWLGALMGEIHPHATDKNEEYRNRQNRLLGYVLSPFGQVRLVYPFVERNWGKYELTKWGVENGMKEMILTSSSCMSGEKGACGRCGVCVRRAGIFKQLGLSEDYVVDPWTAPETSRMLSDIIIAELENDNFHYDEFRRREIIPVIIEKFGTLEKALDYYLDEN